LALRCDAMRRGEHVCGVASMGRGVSGHRLLLLR
jgi:hypothetical protein